MSHRIANQGLFLNRERTVNFTFNGQSFEGFEGDLLSSALLAGGQLLQGRSFKYHRPRGPVAAGAEEPNALFNMESGAAFEPNQRGTTTALYDGASFESQNHWPSLKFDVGAINAKLSRFLPAGFYYKMFIQPRSFWKHVYEPIIRHSAGLGKAPKGSDQDTYEHFHVHVDVLIVGGGLAGLAAALRAGRSGLRVILVEQTPHWGGRCGVDQPFIDGQDAQVWIKETVATLEGLDNVDLRVNMMGAGVYDHGYALAYEQLGDVNTGVTPRHRLWRIRAKRIVSATGAIERPLPFAGNDIPGVMLASAVRDYVTNYGVAVGQRIVVVCNNDDAYRSAICLVEAGLEVVAVLDVRPYSDGDLVRYAQELGVRVHFDRAISSVQGHTCIKGVNVCGYQGDGAVLSEIPCDCVAMSGGWSPVVHLWSHCGGKLIWDDAQVMFRPNRDAGPTDQNGENFVRAVGCANGYLRADEVVSDACGQMDEVVHELGAQAPKVHNTQAQGEDECPLMQVLMMPQNAHYALRAKAFLDFQNDVKVSDVQLAAQEGFESVEHTKRYTTLGMATDQGKLSNINGLQITAQTLGKSVEQVGTTTFRPPYTPISMGAIAGSARGTLFQPVQKTVVSDWQSENGAFFEPVGQWRRPYAYLKGDETVSEAVNREVLAARTSLGLLDASTLGKLIVKGPDAGRFLDMMYTNMMSTLKVGKCRYGLMCNENGFLSDDGVVARLDEQTWLCHTTTGGAARIHGWMEDWLQCEWWDWQVYVANITEQFAQFAVVGPNARKVLEALGSDMDLSREGFPFMDWREGQLGDFNARIFRISFSGELSYEVAVPTGQGFALWRALLEAGREFDVTPYGTEAMHILRAEKGFIMIGEETDGTVIPQDLNLHWAISKKKEDFLGKRAQMRSHMADPQRWKLVGLEALDGSVLPSGAYAIAEGENANGQRHTQGRVTSAYYSATLKRGIAMGLVHHGPARMGEVLTFTNVDGAPIEARIVDPIFFDKEGERQNVE